MHLARVLFSLSCLLAVGAAAAGDDPQQKPLGSPPPETETPVPAVAAIESDERTGWRRGLNFSSPAPHLFSSAYGLLQQWSNTVFPNGHTMAAVEIPAFTLLYHGRMDEEAAPSPEWLAFDM